MLTLLRAIRGDIGEIKADMREVKQRLTLLEIQVGHVASTEQSHYGTLMQRMDRIGADVERISVRLDLVEG
jgi:hypothetical protein